MNIEEIALRVAKAYEALSSLDDFARMDIGVDAIGPRKVLEQFIAGVEAQHTMLAELSKDAEPECVHYEEQPDGSITPVQPEDMGLIVTTVPVVFEDSERDDAYDRIDHFLRNSFDDDNYAIYSGFLEQVYAAPSANTAEIEQRVAEAIAKYTESATANTAFQTVEHYKFASTLASAIRSGKWREYQ